MNSLKSLENRVKKDEEIISNPMGSVSAPQSGGDLVMNPKIIAPNLKIAPSTVEVVEKNTDIYIAGEAINAAVTPQAVYKDNGDGKLYLTQASNTGKRRFFGFVGNNQTLVLDQRCNAVVEGYISGFSGLTNGQFVYLSDTAGSISHTPSTTAVIRAGVAVSATQVLIIEAGKKNIFGTASKGCGPGSTTVTVTLGFRPRFITTSCNSTPYDGVGCGARSTVCNGGWSDSSGQGWSGCEQNASGGLIIRNASAEICSGGQHNADSQIIIQNITETGFDILFKNNGAGNNAGNISYIAVGE